MTPDTPRNREKMVPVSAARPCPVCGKPNWCLIAPDGTAAICQRTESGKKCGDAGFLHRLAEPVIPPIAPKVSLPRPQDWPAAAARFAEAFTPSQRQELADRLNLPAVVFDALPLIGVEGESSAGATFTFPESDATGAVVGINRRSPDGAKKMLPGGNRGLTLPTGWRERPGPLFVVEGPTDALAMTAAGLAAVGRPSANGGAMMLGALLADWPADRGIIVVGENDRKPDGTWPGRSGALSVSRTLERNLGRQVRWALPPEPAKDVRDWLTADERGEAPWPDRGADLSARLTADTGGSDGPPDPAPGGPPVIVIDTDEYRVNDEAAAALAREPDLYQRGGVLVRVAEQAAEPDPGHGVRRPDGTLTVRPLARPLLRERLTRCATWRAWRGAGENAKLAPAHPPDWCVGAVFERDQWPGVRRLDAVTPHPLLLPPDGTVLTAGGYHPGSRVLACLPPGLSVAVPDAPTPAQVAAAVAVLDDVVANFPFEAAAHRAAWVAGLLTPLAWFLFDGPAPLFLIDANVRGAGKGLLADVIGLTLTGCRFPIMSYTPDREELRKRITTVAIEADRFVLLDNLAGPVGNDVLDAALTATRWRDRVLGGNRRFDGPLNVTWYATGNNVQLGADTSRRVCHVRLRSPDERPETKADFRHPRLRSHVLAHRGRLLSAALTILRGWVAAGRPTHGLAAWGSYEGWSDVVREAVVFAGLPDPGDTRDALQTAADRDAAVMSAVLAGLRRLDPAGRGLAARDIALACSDPVPEAPHAELRAAILELCGGVNATALGYRFRSFAARNFGGWMLHQAGQSGGSNLWTVLPVGDRTGRADPPHRPDPPTTIPARAGGRGDEGDEGDVSAGPGVLFADGTLPD